eukprot:538268-Hanusia_phi.AAC.2
MICHGSVLRPGGSGGPPPGRASFTIRGVQNPMMILVTGVRDVQGRARGLICDYAVRRAACGQVVVTEKVS